MPTKEYYWNNRDLVLKRKKEARARKRIEDPGCRREEQRRYREKNPYSPDCPKAVWQRKNRHRANAHKAVAYEVRMGRMVYPESCEVCGAREKLHAHHDSYDRDRRLAVVFMCSPCHGQLHVDRAKQAGQ